MSDLEAVQKRTGLRFNDQQLLQQVFVHRSYLNEHRSFPLGHNERLEFLGDAVLELVVTEYLYRNFPNPEGELTNWRSSLVKGEMLAKIAVSLEFSEHLLLSYGETRSGGKNKNQLLANAFEALLGALYMDQGYLPCQDFIQRTVTIHLQEILEQRLFVDPKSELQELTQEKYGITPHYLVLEESGPDHAKEFAASVRIGDKELGRGTGNSKQSAQVSAAQAALVGLKGSLPADVLEAPV